MNTEEFVSALKEVLEIVADKISLPSTLSYLLQKKWPSWCFSSTVDYSIIDYLLRNGRNGLEVIKGALPYFVRETLAYEEQLSGRS